MVKVKKNLSELVQQRAQSNKKRLNPFEVHINREKQKILGRKGKNDRGLPGVSRAKAINKRKQSLLQEYKQRNKTNVFLDRRIGEKNSAMSMEDRATARFAMERMKAYEKKNIYNLNDDEVLTHRGRTIREIQQFDDPRSDDEFSDDENNSGKLDKRFVEEAHFGGGILSKPGAASSRKNVIEQLIAESKRLKAEKQKLREQTLDLTEKLDSEWKDLLPLVSVSKKADEDASEATRADAYDIAVRELKFEARGNPTEKLKSEEQIVQEEKERLEALEADRLARMKGFVSDANNERKHKSADDLDDDYLVETIAEDVDDNNNDDDLSTDDNHDNEEDEEGSDVEDDDENDNDEIDDDEIDDDNDVGDNKREKTPKSDNTTEKNIKVDENDSRNREKPYSESSNVKDESDADPNDEDPEGDESEDNLSDLKVTESSSEDESEAVKKRVTFIVDTAKNTGLGQKNQSDQVYPKSILKRNNDAARHVPNSSEGKDNQREIRDDLLKRKEIMEKARKELPYTYKAPESFEELEKLLESRNSEYQSVIVDRIIKCNHWTLDGKNKEKLSNLFVYLLQHINNCACADEADDLIKCFQIFDRLCPYLYDLAHMNAEMAKTCIQEVIKEKHDEFERSKRKYPEMDTLIFFKLVSLLFPTSDFRHPIVTPALVFMSQILLRSRIKSRRDIAKGLFICTLVLEYTVLSKRFAPSAINFLRGIVYAATPEVCASTPKIKIIPPFKTAYNFLVIDEKQTNIEIDPNSAHMTASDLIHEELDDKFRIRTLITAVNLIREFKDELQELEAAYSIFEPILKLLKLNKFKKYPSNIRKRIKELRKELEILRNKKLEYLVLEKKGPKPLRMYEPKIMTVYDGKRHKPMSKEKAEREKLQHKCKRERKGAMREIRRDSAFLAKVQISEQIKNDAERKRKVNEIIHDAAMQQHEFKKMRRKR